MNYAIIHQHDHNFISEYVKSHHLDKVDCLATKNPSLADNQVFGIENCDNHSYFELNSLPNTYFIKIISPNDTIYEQITHIIFADEIVNLCSVTKKTGEIIFTSGRCGTNMLRDNLGLGYFHHSSISCVYPLMKYKVIHTVIRNNFADLVSSVIIANRCELIVTTDENYAENINEVKLWKPFDIHHDEIIDIFDSFKSYADILVFLSSQGSKVNLNYMHSLNTISIKTKKNPYNKKVLILNYDYLMDEANKLQSDYQNIIDKIKKHIQVNNVGL